MARQRLQVDTHGWTGDPYTEPELPEGFVMHFANDSLGTTYPVATLDATAGAVTLTAAQVQDGLFRRDPNGLPRADNTPTAAALVALYPNAKVGDCVRCIYTNEGAATEDITITAGAGVTVVGSGIIEDGDTGLLIFQFTNVTASSEAALCFVIS